jgi:predicted transcriptional regulator of viral defense system
MKFQRLLEIVGDEPIFESALLLAGSVDADNLYRQLSRWVRAGRLYRLRRGLYALAPPYQKTRPHPFLVANRMLRGSYVSLQAALAHYGLIPEYTPVVTSVSTARPARWDTPLGRYEFRHLQAELLCGYRLLELGGAQSALVATPEKALLDLVYLQTGGHTPAYLQTLRLQNLERLDLEQLERYVQRPRLRRAAEFVANLALSEAAEYETL